jgi:hypothetical protein
VAAKVKDTNQIIKYLALGCFLKLWFLVQKPLLKCVKRSFWTRQKNYNYPPKTLTFDPSRCEALIKKLWHSTDQEIVATTNPADHQTELQKPVTGQKDHPHQGVIQHPVPIAPITTNQEKNIAVSVPVKKDLFHRQEANLTKAVSTRPQAALAAGQVKRNPFHRETGRIPAGQAIMMTSVKGASAVNRLEKRDHPRQRAGLIQAEQPIMIQGLQKAPIAIGVELKEPGIKNLFNLVVSRQVLKTGQKEILHGNHPARKSHSKHAVNLLRAHSVLTTGLKRPTAVKERVIKNSHPGHQQMAGLKNAMKINHITPTGRNAQNLRTEK